MQGKSLEDFNKKALKKALKAEEKRQVPTLPLFYKLPAFPKLTNTGSFAAWFVVTGDVTPDGYASSGWFLEPLAPLPSWFFENSSLAWPNGAVYPAWPGGEGDKKALKKALTAEEERQVQGYLAHKKHPPHRKLR